MDDRSDARSVTRDVARKIAAICGTALVVFGVIVAVKALLRMG